MRRPTFRHTATLIALVTLLHAAKANADCPAAPIANANDMAISFLASNGVQASSASLLASSVKEGTLIYDDTADKLKICDGASWIEVGSGGGSSATANAGYLQLSDGTTLTDSGTTAGQQLFWDNTNKRLGIGTATPITALDVVGVPLAQRTFAAYYARDIDAATIDDIGGNFAFQDLSGNIGQSFAVAGGNLRIVQPSTTKLIELWTNGNARMVVTPSGTVGIGVYAPNASSLLDLTSTTKGFLPPRMTTAQRNAIASPAAGLMIFNTTDGQFQYYTGTVWAGVGYSVPTGTIAAFASTSCPTGWTEYTPARGRFLRGIDNGAGNDPAGTRAPGNTQADDFASHTHQMQGSTTAGASGGGVGFKGASSGFGTGFNDGSLFSTPTVASGGSTETRPKNVAVLYCQYTGAGGGGGGATTLVALTDVNITSPSDGQVLKYDNATSKWVNGTASGGSLSGGTSGHLGVWTGATTLGLSSTTAGQQLFWDATNHRLGIGTVTPTSALHVNGGNIRNSGLAAPGLVVVPTTGSSYVFGANTAISGAGIYDNTATVWRLVVKDTTGNIGIGLNNPKARLDIYGVGSGATPATSGTDDATMNLRVSRGTVGVDTGMLDSGVGYMQVRNISNLATTYALSLQPTGGNVGIGTVNPQSLLQVAGGIQLGDDAAACPGASDVKVGTLRFNTGNIQLCTTGGWGAISGGGTLSGGTSGYLGVWSGATTMGLSGTSAGQQLFWDGASNRLLLGSVTAYQTDGSVTPRVQVHGTTSTASSLSLTSWLNGANNPGSLILGHSKSATIGTNVLVDSGDALGGIYFNGDGGAGFRRAAYIQANVDATPGTNNMPGRLIFATSAVGSATPTERMRIDSAGNVGIGTTAPDVPLEFAATTGEKIRLWDGGAGSRLGIGLNAANFQFFTGAGGNNFSFNTGGDLQATGTNELMRIQANGNVGIGTTSPTSALHVNSAGNTVVNISSSFSNSPTTGLNIDTVGDASVGRVVFQKSATTRGLISYAHNATGAAEAMNFDVSGGAQEVTILGSGNVGIGTTTPGQELEVASTTPSIRLRDTDNASVFTDITAFEGTAATGNPYFDISPVGDAAQNAIIRMFRATNTSGTVRLDILRGNNSTAVNAAIAGNGDTYFAALNGNVGIGTTAPGSALDVKGTLRLSGSTSGYVGFAPAAAAGSTTYTLPSADGSSGQVLSTNGSGTLSWATAGVAGMTYLTTLTASNSATLDYTGISAAYDVYLFILSNVIPTNNHQQLHTRISTDGGASWRSSSYMSQSSSNSVPVSYGVKNDGAGSGAGVSGEVTIFEVNRTDNKKMIKTETCAPTDDGYGNAYLPCPNYNGYWTGGNNAVNGVRFYFGAGNISSGRIRVYGIKTN